MATGDREPRVHRQHLARDVGRGVGIVHGMREKRIADSDDVMATAEDWLRQSLLKTLSDVD